MNVTADLFLTVSDQDLQTTVSLASILYGHELIKTFTYSSLYARNPFLRRCRTRVTSSLIVRRNLLTRTTTFSSRCPQPRFPISTVIVTRTTQRVHHFLVARPRHPCICI